MFFSTFLLSQLFLKFCLGVGDFPIPGLDDGPSSIPEEFDRKDVAALLCNADGNVDAAVDYGFYSRTLNEDDARALGRKAQNPQFYHFQNALQTLETEITDELETLKPRTEVKMSDFTSEKTGYL